MAASGGGHEFPATRIKVGLTTLGQPMHQVGTAPRAVLCAKVQIGLRPVQRCKRERHLQVPGLGPQVSGTGYQVQVRVRGNSGPEPVPEPEHLNLAPDRRDPRPEMVSLPTFALLHRSSAPICTFALSLSGPPSLRPSCPRVTASPRHGPR